MSTPREPWALLRCFHGKKKKKKSFALSFRMLHHRERVTAPGSGRKHCSHVEAWGWILTELGKPPTWPRLPKLLENYWATKLCKNSFQKSHLVSIPPNSIYITNTFPLTTGSRFLLEPGVKVGGLAAGLGLKMKEEKQGYVDKSRSSPTPRAWMSKLRVKFSSSEAWSLQVKDCQSLVDEAWSLSNQEMRRKGLEAPFYSLGIVWPVHSLTSTSGHEDSLVIMLSFHNLIQFSRVCSKMSERQIIPIKAFLWACGIGQRR